MRDPGAALRTWSPGYIGAVDAWWGALLPRVRPLLLSHGGPVAMVQVAARRRALAPPLTLYKTARKGCAGRAAAGRAGGGLSGGRAGFQVENEFGHIGGDPKYMEALRDMMLSGGVRPEALLPLIPPAPQGLGFRVQDLGFRD